MGFGDALMATAEARVLHQRTGRPVAVGDGRALRLRPAECEVFAGVPFLALALDGQAVAWLPNYSGSRPYLDYARMAAEGHPGAPPWRYTAWSVSRYGPGVLRLTAAERAWAAEALAAAGVARPFVVVEPTVKPQASPNKAWGVARYAEVAAALAREVAVVQVGPAPSALPGAVAIQTPSFRQACAVLAQAAAYLGPDGGLHHAAAALGVPAVVLFGGFTSPAQTGYPGHVNLFTGGAPCGEYRPCAHCQAAWAAITPADVIAAARGLW